MSFFSWVQDAISSKPEDNSIVAVANAVSQKTKSTAGHVLRTSNDPEAKELAAAILGSSTKDDAEKG